MNHPIRVLQVVTHMERGGLETMLMNYYRHIDHSRVQFDFLVHRDNRAAYDDEIESLGGKIYRLPRLVPWSFSYRKALDKFFDSHPEYRIVHVHQDCLSSIILKAAKKNGVPVRIAHSHSSSQDKNLKYLIKLWYKRQIPRYATKLFSCGQQAGDWMFGAADYEILNNAIDVSAYTFQSKRKVEIRSSLNIPATAFVVGHVGRFSYPKNHEFLLDVFSALYMRCADAYLLLVGEGELRKKMEDKAASLGIDHRVIFTGLRSDVPDLLQVMDVFVFPSHYEGLPLTMVEAQAAGLPCIISDKVPDECAVTDLVRQLPLDLSAEQWADQVLTCASQPRRNTQNEIISAGYDVLENSHRLEMFYLQKVAAQ